MGKHDFQEVMHHFHRICEMYGGTCNDGKTRCALDKSPICNKNARNLSDEDIAESEQNIMAWATEHPEYVSKTWCEYLVEIGVLPERMSTIPSQALTTIGIALSKPIPAGIAIKLGIKPKED